MPRYFFDIWHLGHVNRDVDGIELPDASHIRVISSPIEEATAATGLGLAPPRSVSVVVRDSSDAIVYRSACKPPDDVEVIRTGTAR